MKKKKSSFRIKYKEKLNKSFVDCKYMLSIGSVKFELETAVDYALEICRVSPNV